MYTLLHFARTFQDIFSNVFLCFQFGFIREGLQIIHYKKGTPYSDTPYISLNKTRDKGHNNFMFEFSSTNNIPPNIINALSTVA